MAIDDPEGYKPRRRRTTPGGVAGEPTPGQGWPVTSQAPTQGSQGQPTQYVQPFSYQAPAYQGYGSFNQGQVGQYNVPDPYQVSQAPQFYVDPFRYPSGEDLFEDPSYQSRLNAGLKALERSAAARGTLRSGNTLQDLMKYGQDYASQEYAAASDRAARQYGLNYQASRDMYEPSRAQWEAQNLAGMAGWQARNLAGMSAWEQQNLLRQQEEQRRWMEYQFRLDDEFRRQNMLYQGGLSTF